MGKPAPTDTTYAWERDRDSKLRLPPREREETSLLRGPGLLTITQFSICAVQASAQ